MNLLPPESGNDRDRRNRRRHAARAAATSPRCGARSRSCSRTRWARSPAHDGRRHPHRAAAGGRLDRPGPGSHPGRRADGAGRSGPGARRPVPGGVLRRAAPAHRDRPRAGDEAVAAGARRAGVRPRRLGAGRGAEPAHRAAARAGAELPVPSRTTCRWCGTSRTGSVASCTWAGSWSPARSPTCSATRSILHPGAAVGDPGAGPAGRTDPAAGVLSGDLPSPTDDAPGCAFLGRCPLARTLSEQERSRCAARPPSSWSRTARATPTSDHRKRLPLPLPHLDPTGNRTKERHAQTHPTRGDHRRRRALALVLAGWGGGWLRRARADGRVAVDGRRRTTPSPTRTSRTAARSPCRSART